MKRLEGDDILININEEWIQQGGLSTTLFAASRNINSAEHAISGYLDELTAAKKSDQIKIIERIKSINRKNQKTVNLLDNLRSMCDLNLDIGKNVYIEDLLSKISIDYPALTFKSLTTYKNSLVNVDVDVFTTALAVLLLSGTNSSVYKTKFSKKDGLGTLHLQASGKMWISKKLITMINNVSQPINIHKNLDLSEIVCRYAISVLRAIDVAVGQHTTINNQILYIKIPLARQLNVFE